MITFKTTNDRYGHLAGDEVIVTVVNELRKRIRATDIIGRYGGEEFAILLTETDRESAFVVAENIRRQVADREILFKGEVIKTTISIGISTAGPEDTEITVEKLIDQADQALYSANNSGKNKVL